MDLLNEQIYKIFKKGNLQELDGKDFVFSSQ